MKIRFNYDKMRRTFSEWYEGQSSAMYAAHSTGLVEDTEALQAELLECVTLILNDPQRRYRGRLRQEDQFEALYLRRIADALPMILSTSARHPRDDRLYRCLPWVSEAVRDSMDWMPVLRYNEVLPL